MIYYRPDDFLVLDSINESKVHGIPRGTKSPPFARYTTVNRSIIITSLTIFITAIFSNCSNKSKVVFA